MEIILALCLGVTLSAASGFRLFLPPLTLSLAALSGDLELSAGFDWVGTYPTAIALGVATVIEILAYYSGSQTHGVQYFSPSPFPFNQT